MIITEVEAITAKIIAELGTSLVPSSSFLPAMLQLGNQLSENS